MLCVSVVSDASAGLPCAQLGPCFLQKAEVAPENSSSSFSLGPGDSQLWAEEGMCNVLQGRMPVAEGLQSFPKAKLGPKKRITIS